MGASIDHWEGYIGTIGIRVKPHSEGIFLILGIISWLLAVVVTTVF